MTQKLLERKYQYRRRPPHFQKENYPVFVTFRLWGLDPLAGNIRDIVLNHCLHDHMTKILLHAVVIMPDHVHLLFTPLRNPDGYLYSVVEILQGIKGASAHSINRVLRCSGPVWQDESFDHVLRSEESLKQKIDYIRQNPVRRGLVARAEDYPWLWVERG